jgi:hypothetical protein
VDFSRSCRFIQELKDPNNLVRCDHQLLEKLKALDAKQSAAKTKGYLTKDELKAVMARRDKMVVRFEQLVSERVRPLSCIDQRHGGSGLSCFLS